MTALVSLIAAYLAAVMIGTKSRKLGGSTIFVLAVFTVVEVIIVLISMFLMAPPPGGRPGQG